MDKKLDEVRAVVNEVIKASHEYMKKEDIRRDMQSLAKERIDSGEIKDEESLKEFWNTVSMAMNALRLVPFEAFVEPGLPKR